MREFPEQFFRRLLATEKFWRLLSCLLEMNGIKADKEPVKVVWKLHQDFFETSKFMKFSFDASLGDCRVLQIEGMVKVVEYKSFMNDSFGAFWRLSGPPV